MAGRKKKKEILIEPDKRQQVADMCEKIVTASNDMEQAKMEYRILKDYLDDIDIIEELPNSSYSELVELAKGIKSVGADREAIESSSSKMTKDRYEFFNANEKNMSKTIELMSEDEKRLRTVKGDLNNLEGEKEALKIERQELENKLNVLQNVAKLAIILLVISFIIYIIMAFIFEMDIKAPVFITVGVGALITLTVFVANRKIVYNMKMTDIKLNKAITLLNGVKLKYVNVMSTLEYIYEKNEVHSSYELSHMWGNYITSKKDKDMYDRAVDKLYDYSERLVGLLERYKLKEPEIWVSQAGALINEDERKEIKDTLCMKSLRAKGIIEESYNNIENAKKVIEEIVKKNASDAEEFLEIVESYGEIL